MKTDPTYSSTYIRTLEKYLLDQTDIDRMVGAKDVQEALKVLENTNYARELKESISKILPKDYRKILLTDLQIGKKLLLYLVEDVTLIKLTLLTFDIHNIKIFFKEKFFTPLEKVCLMRLISLHGSQKPEELRKAVEGEKADIDEDFQRLIKETEEKFKKKPLASELDIYLDKKIWHLSSLLAKKMESDFLQNFIKKKIDILNLKTILRAYLLNKLEKLEEWLIEGGNIGIKKFAVLGKAQNIREAIQVLIPLFPKKIARVMELYLREGETPYQNFEGGSLDKLFRELDNIEIEELKESKFISEGPEIIFCYFLARFNANRNVRIILEGKLEGFEQGEILEKIRLPF